jgi:AraC family transcriptional regulator
MKIDLGWVCLELLPRAPYSVQGASADWTFGFAFERQYGVHAVANDHRQDFDAWPGALACTPPGVDVFSESPRGGEYLTMHVSPSRLDKQQSHITQTRRVFEGSRQAMELGLNLRRLLLAQRPDGLQIEERAAALLAHSLALLGHPVPAAAFPTATTRRLLSATLDRIEADLPNPITLQTLAASAALSPLRFLRLFTKVVGATPHAYISERRVQRARQLLRTSDESLATIALDCGFAHQSHMGAAFKAQLGLTPLVYRSSSVKPGRCAQSSGGGFGLADNAAR